MAAFARILPVHHESEQQSFSVIRRAACVFVAGAILFFWLRREPGPADAPISPTTTQSHPLNQGHYRLAVMESFGALDSRVARECVPPLTLNKKWFANTNEFYAVTQFLSVARKYDAPEPLIGFMKSLDQLLTQPRDQWPADLLEHFSVLPGSDPVLKNVHNLDVIDAIQQIANRRIQQLLMERQSGHLQTLLDRGLQNQMRAVGVELTLPDGVPVKPSAVLRYWELSSTGYLLCQSANTTANLIVQNLFSGQFHPEYRNAPNAVLDPVKRRFRVLSMVEVVMAGNLSGQMQVRSVPAGNISIMKFDGALPRAKLYSDWRFTPDDAAAKVMVFSPSFNPQFQVVLRPVDIPSPERPAQTDKLPMVRIKSLNANRVELDLPPLDHNAVLLLTNEHEAGWRAREGTTILPVVRANLNSCAVYLPAAEAERRIEFVRP